MLASGVLILSGVVALVGGLRREDTERQIRVATVGATVGVAVGATVAATASTEVSGVANDADVMFAQMLIPHHGQALTIVRLAATRATDHEVKTLAAAIGATQIPEAASMASWLRLWRKPPTAQDDAHAAHGGMPGVTPQELATLRDSRGTDFDRRFLHMMIAHQDDALQMARRELHGGRNPQARLLATRIEQSRSAQIKQMLAMLDRLPER